LDLVIVVALIARMILIMCLFSAWMAFKKNRGPTFRKYHRVGALPET